MEFTDYIIVSQMVSQMVNQRVLIDTDEKHR